jgi:O-antigen/teichoic acid export membrane protein
MRIIQRGLIALIVLGAAPIAAHIYSDDRVTLIMVAVGLAELICAFENIYTVNLRKNLNFKADFVYMAVPRFASFLAAVSSVVILESYWGLVIGICTMELARTTVSYLIIKEKPKWSLKRWRDIFNFSTWYMLRGIGDFISNESDRFILGILGGAKVTGLFNVAKEIATLPVTEIVLPIGRALTPTLAKISNDHSRLSSAIEKSITGTIIIAAPTSLGFSAISHEFISLLFGEKWLGAIPILSILCFGGVAYAIKETAANALVIYNKIKLSTYISWLSAFIILITIYPTYLNFETEGVAWLLVATNILTAITSIFLLCRLKLINANEIIKGIARPTLSAVIMLISINWLVDHISINSHSTAAAIAVKIMLGSIIYTFTITLLWFASGKPNSSEKVLLTIFLNKFFK